jgi:hypothetical protein
VIRKSKITRYDDGRAATEDAKDQPRSPSSTETVPEVESEGKTETVFDNGAGDALH